MATINYYSTNGLIIGEKPDASTRIDYLADALGSVTTTVDQASAVKNTYRYKPYGGQLAKTGVATDPAFGWVGSLGYRLTGLKYSDTYVRARHYSTQFAEWLVADPIEFGRLSNRYTYVKVNPTRWVDYTGRKPAMSGNIPSNPSGPDLDQDCCSSRNQDWYFGGNMVGVHCKTGWISCSGWESIQCRPSGSPDECNAILNRLNDLANSCNKGCDQSSFYPDTAGWSAATMCCNKPDGTPQFCGVRCCDRSLNVPRYGNIGAINCIKSCLMGHEKRHQSKDCTKTRSPVSDCRAWSVNYDECCAYKDEIGCLTALYSGPCSNYWQIPNDGPIGKCLNNAHKCG